MHVLSILIAATTLELKEEQSRYYSSYVCPLLSLTLNRFLRKGHQKDVLPTKYAVKKVQNKRKVVKKGRKVSKTKGRTSKEHRSVERWIKSKETKLVKIKF